MNLHVTIHEEIITGFLTIFLCITHYLSPEIKRIKGLSSTKIISFAGGVAVGYVFLHMLPELVESRDKIHELLDKVTSMSQFKDLIVFVIALIGFELYYLLERFTVKHDASNSTLQKRSYAFNMAFYFIYNVLITYTLILFLETGFFYVILYSIAMGLHFILSDRHFNRYYPKLFGKRSHLLLIFALVFGYVLSIIAPINIYVSAMLTAFLSGAILYNAFSEEIALDRQTSMGAFFLGSLIMALLLGIVLVR